MRKRILITLFIAGGTIAGAYYFFTAKTAAIRLEHYYDYDRSLPLDARIDTLSDRLWHVRFTSAHALRVPGLLSFPRRGRPPYPTIIFLHGAGDNKATDYMMLGDSIFADAGLAVFRIDADLHGERIRNGMAAVQAKNYPYLARDAVAQTVFDLRRAVDFLDSIPQLDSTRTAFMGISLGGIIGAIFAGVDRRVEYPIIVLAGGGLRWIFGARGISSRIRDLMAPVEPLNFIDKIAPRPVLFLNASHDEVIPRATTLLLYQAARQPKEIIWYDGQHHMQPLPPFRDSVAWLRKWMRLPESVSPSE